MNEKRKNKRTSPPLAFRAVSDDIDVWDMVNRYGTYNTQNTSGTENDYPKIAQTGTNKDKKNSNKK